MKGIPRSYLYVPADRPRFLRRAFDAGADAVILDLEDAVAPSRKDAARAAALSTLSDRPDGIEVWVRLNSGRRGLEDATAVLSNGGADGIWMPKAESGQHFRELTALIAEVAPVTVLGLLVESASGLLGFGAMIDHHAVGRLQIGEVDLRADLSMPAVGDDFERLSLARSWLIMHAASVHLPPPVAPVSVDVSDMEAFRSTSQRLKEMGFGGRACIHPAQVAVANETFGVGPDELAAAHAVIDEFKRRAEKGEGAFRDADGAMVDEATVRRARMLTGRMAGYGWSRPPPG